MAFGTFRIKSNATLGEALTLCLAIGATCVLFFTIIRLAWACDDAFIVYRTIQQFFSGNGLRFNITDRVQAYTSPLWLMLQCLPKSFSNHEFINSIGLSLLLDLLMVITIWRHFKKPSVFTLCIGLMLLSTAVMEFTTSGLEYPLIFCTTIVFFSCYFKFQSDPSSSRLLQISAIAGLILITRHDLLFTVIFPILHVASTVIKKRLPWKTASLLLISPLAIWSLFSTLYYGVPLPNTAYAKLGTSDVIPHMQMIEQGFLYFAYGMEMDPASFGIMGIGILLGLSSRHTAYKLTAQSILLASVYIVWVSGDFMLGRFYAHLVLLSIFLIGEMCNQPSSRWATTPTSRVYILACWVVVVALSPMTPVRAPTILKDGNNDIGWHRISWERSVYSRFMSLPMYIEHAPEEFPYGPPFNSMREFYASTTKKQSDQSIAIGAAGYLAPPDHYIDDEIALTDFFRARMPMSYRYWHTGHTSKFYPEGYPQALINNQARLSDPDLDQYLQIVKLITQSEDLFTRQRLLTIAKFNLGEYDYLLARSKTLPRWYKQDIFNGSCSHIWVLEQWMTIW